MRKRLLMAVVIALVLSATAGLSMEYGLGLLYQDPREIPGAVILNEVPIGPGALNHTVQGSAPDGSIFKGSVDLSEHFPPVRSQGSQGSCVAFSIGYYLRTYVEWQEQAWDVTDSTHQFSPAFIYNQINGGVDGGSFFYDAALILERMGCSTWAEWPYSQHEWTRWPTRTECLQAMPYRIGGHYWIYTGDPLGVDEMRQLLLNNTAVVLGIYCWSNFVYIENYNNIYCASERYGTNYGGHGVAIVGFDDSLMTNDGMGAFRVINSWGTSWGDSGFCWITYQAVQDSFCSQLWAITYDDRIGYQPTVVGQANLSHARRGNLDVVIGSEIHTNPVWQTCVAGSLAMGQYWHRDTLHPFTADTLCFDLTDGSAFLTPGRDVYLGAGDAAGEGLTGTIGSFTVRAYTGELWGESLDPPVAIPDIGWAYAYLTLLVGVQEAGRGDSPAGLKFQVFPNPADAWTRVLVLNSEGRDLRFVLYDLTGRQAARWLREKGEHSFQLDTWALPSGLYLLRLHDGREGTSRKVMVIH